MGNRLYLECYSGISGDMTVAALLDLGADKHVLLEVLESLTIKGFQTEITRVKKAGLDVCDFHVILDDEHENHDHDMEYLYGHLHRHEHRHEHDGEQGHHHEHGEHHHEHRGLTEILEIIEGAQMSPRAKELAAKIFRILAQAEAEAHVTAIDQVHFHEVGAVDSIVDIIAAAVCLDNLNITDVIVPYLCEGRGTVRCRHGIIPVPVPAVTHVLREYQIPLKLTEAEGELVTPTGAAIVAAVRTTAELPKVLKIERIGLGAGKREYGLPGFVRAMLLAKED